MMKVPVMEKQETIYINNQRVPFNVFLKGGFYFFGNKSKLFHGLKGILGLM